MKLLLLSRGHTSSKDRLFGGDQTIPEQLLQGTGRSGRGTRLTSFREEQAQRSGRNVLPHVLFAPLKQQPLALSSRAVAQSCANVLGRPPKIPGTKPQPVDVPAHHGQRNRLMGDSQPLSGLLGGKLKNH